MNNDSREDDIIIVRVKEFNSDITSFYARIRSGATELDNCLTYMCAHVCHIACHGALILSNALSTTPKDDCRFSLSETLRPNKRAKNNYDKKK